METDAELTPMQLCGADSRSGVHGSRRIGDPLHSLMGVSTDVTRCSALFDYFNAEAGL
jgi:hypothetical protein